MSGLRAAAPGVYQRHRAETTALYEVVRDNLETLYGAIEDGAIAVRIPKHARKELESYLDCGLLCRGFARLKCERREAAGCVQLQAWHATASRPFMPETPVENGGAPESGGRNARGARQSPFASVARGMLRYVHW